MPELEFRGKEFVRNHHLTLPFRPLVPDAARSVGDADLDGSLIIHGDNLHALKAQLPRYAGKVDRIFIDSPYNSRQYERNYFAVGRVRHREHCCPHQLHEYAVCRVHDSDGGAGPDC
jgi:hypothetical protein